MVMKSIFSTPGKTTMPTQPATTGGPASQQPYNKPGYIGPKPTANPNTAMGGLLGNPTGTGTPWQRGTRGMDRVKMGGVNSYAPQRPPGGHTDPRFNAQPMPTKQIGGGYDPTGTVGQPSPGQSPQSPFLPGNMGGGGTAWTDGSSAFDLSAGSLGAFDESAGSLGVGNGLFGGSGGQQLGIVPNPIVNGQQQGYDAYAPGGVMAPGGRFYQAPQQPQGNISSRLFAQPGSGPTAMGFGGIGVAPTGDTSTWSAGDWQRYNSNQQLAQSMMSGG